MTVSQFPPGPPPGSAPPPPGQPPGGWGAQPSGDCETLVGLVSQATIQEEGGSREAAIASCETVVPDDVEVPTADGGP
jgi:hypothetical protein